MSYYVALRAVCCTHFGIDPAAPGAPLPEPIRDALFALGGYGYPRRDLDGAGLRRLLEDVDRLRCSIGALDQRTMPYVLRETPDYRQLTERMIAGEIVEQPPREQWFDARMLATLSEFREAVAAVAARHAAEVAWRPNGSGGRRPARPPYMVARIAARLYRDMAHTAPTFWTGGETPYARLLGDIFDSLGIEADTRRPAEWAIRQVAGQNA